MYFIYGYKHKRFKRIKTDRYFLTTLPLAIYLCRIITHSMKSEILILTCNIYEKRFKIKPIRPR